MLVRRLLHLFGRVLLLTLLLSLVQTGWAERFCLVGSDPEPRPMGRQVAADGMPCCMAESPPAPSIRIQGCRCVVRGAVAVSDIDYRNDKLLLPDWDLIPPADFKISDSRSPIGSARDHTLFVGAPPRKIPRPPDLGRAPPGLCFSTNGAS